MKIGRYDTSETIAESVECAEKTFGIELTFLEKMRMKQFVEPVLREKLRVAQEHPPGDARGFDPVREVVARFMIMEYGLPLDYANPICPRRAGLYGRHRREFSELLKWYQQERDVQF
ncbi:MAG: hypothetical protein A3D48_04325 [Candidatus Yanofskybacteria bacterium RIFCSPHIGHO2_02_FULL_43_17]|nr:MAG: hypothetical protein A3D48_04325 [Candidatus Yanofskybacteria bacterium RIFCSPHIGHO2_02_FULL_43_17]